MKIFNDDGTEIKLNDLEKQVLTQLKNQDEKKYQKATKEIKRKFDRKQVTLGEIYGKRKS